MNRFNPANPLFVSLRRFSHSTNLTNYIVSARAIKDGSFIPEGVEQRKSMKVHNPIAKRMSFLAVPQSTNPSPECRIPQKEWFQRVADGADGLVDGEVGEVGQVLVYVHGYSNTAETIVARHETLQSHLKAEGWKGLVISFDWPCGESTLGYLEDRTDAAATSRLLVDGLLPGFAKLRDSGCDVDVHLLGHSMGAYVIRESFSRSVDRGSLYRRKWGVSQVAFVGADISARSLTRDQELFKRSERVTNYFSGFDYVLKASNAKRGALSPRAGRVGLDNDNLHPKATNVNCTGYFARNKANPDIHQHVRIGTFAHSWYIGNTAFAQDLALTLSGRVDRGALPTRSIDRFGRLHLEGRADSDFPLDDLL